MRISILSDYLHKTAPRAFHIFLLALFLQVFGILTPNLIFKLLFRCHGPVEPLP